MSNRPISVAEAAKRCPYSEVTLRRLAKRGDLPCHRAGRRVFFLEHELQEKLGPLFRAQ